jgi:hypothetical protein
MSNEHNIFAYLVKHETNCNFNFLLVYILIIK